eukprot:CAMPEP_0197022064 /NCGR_PEP_ID=MMETSP1384-20130603/2970_1 /TAXON_ID=29189 /ORGANISM="Ammonia sp." /LENGTH=617 /DNA_ID=CAMNT_0042450029 /DNA_START=36 /DNA_END=1889 /DNA_ORIENTATION=+
MDDHHSEEDEDAKAHILEDEEGDPMTGGGRIPSKPNVAANVVISPRKPPPILDNFQNNGDIQLEESNSNKQPFLQSPNSDTGPDFGFSNHMDLPDTHIKHVPSKSVPVSLPLFWTCSICTFAENGIDSPVCGVCGALPPMDNVKQKKKKRKNKAKGKPAAQAPPVPVPTNANSLLSPRAYQPSHHQHALWEQQQTRQRHTDHQHGHHHQHQRAVSAQIQSPQTKPVPFNVDHMLPNFLEEDPDEKEYEPPSYLKQDSIAMLVTKNNAISVLHEIPQQEKELIVKQINKISSKKELQIELYSVKMTLAKKIKFHNTRITAFNKQLSKLKSEYEIQRQLWDEYYIILLQKLCKAYFEKLFKLIEIRISIEKFYLECFEHKVEKVTAAYDKLDETIAEWNLNDTREYVQSTMFVISKIRTSPELNTQKEKADKLKEAIARMEKKYEEKKELLNVSKVDHKKRAAHITLYLKQVIDEFNAANKNIKLTETYFCRADIQENFNSFLLDQRVECGKIVKNWLNFLLQNVEQEILFKDVYIFVERLINTFCKLYGLETNGKYNFHEYSMRFTYVAVLNLDIVHQILQRIASTEQGKKEYQILSQHADYTLFAHFLRLKYKLGSS